MPSFDIVSKIDMQEINNAVANAMKEITQRYDFKGSISNLKIKDQSIVLETEDELKAKQVNELLIGHLVKRKVDPKAIDLKSTEKAAGNTIRQVYELTEGIDQKVSKKVISEVKNSKLKVQVKIQGDELRVSGAKRDDLQKVIEIAKGLKLDLPLQFLNFRD
ncbi:MAG: YajQ family cyclic di-GMP-binding protein [Paracoccaceae bacterium]|nr:YajQ family cyclic di-GMP-binding protein [Paracoccaceae bacterium]|tara:strand:- start:403 stop:888 length:486 start_codon:yes stop_codon:yes gene_type:complete